MLRIAFKLALVAVPALGLLGLFSVALLRWRESANRERCKDHLRRVGWFALWQYTDREFAFPGGRVHFADRRQVLRVDREPPADRAFPPGTIAHPTLSPERRLAWPVLLLPYIGHEDVFAKFDQSKGWEDEANRDGRVARVPSLACPSQYQRPAPGEPQLFAYIGMAGLGPDAALLPASDPRAGFFRYDSATTTNMLRRGFSYTMTILESGRVQGPWAAGGPPTVRGLDPAQTPYIGMGRPFGGHANGAFAAFADGSVRFQAHSISPRLLEKLATLAELDPSNE